MSIVHRVSTLPHPARFTSSLSLEPRAFRLRGFGIIIQACALRVNMIIYSHTLNAGDSANCSRRNCGAEARLRQDIGSQNELNKVDTTRSSESQLRAGKLFLFEPVGPLGSTIIWDKKPPTLPIACTKCKLSRTLINENDSIFKTPFVLSISPNLPPRGNTAVSCGATGLPELCLYAESGQLDAPRPSLSSSSARLQR